MATRSFRSTRGAALGAWCVTSSLLVIVAGCRSASPHDVPQSAPSVAAVAPAPDPNRGCNLAIADRTSDAGCWVTVQTSLGVLNDGPLFWHVYGFPSTAAAESARSARGAVAESFDKHWLFAIGPEGWRPSSGERLAVVGPLNIRRDVPYTARYMEATFPPDFTTALRGHRHSGAEAWYVVSGAQCLETPDGPMVLRAGQSGMVAEGPPMYIAVVGPETRRSVLVVLHPTAEPWVTNATDWTPKGSCPK